MRTAFSCWNVMILASAYVFSKFVEDAAAEVTPRFRERHFGGRRKYGCSVTADIRVTVFLGNRNFSPADQCASNNASSIADLSSMAILRRCLTYVFHLSPVHTVRLDADRYIDINTMTTVSPRSPYRVVCLAGNHTLAHPVITSFTLQLWDDKNETILWAYNLLDSNSTSVTIPATNNTLNVSCRVSGYPKPQVVIAQDNETCDTLPCDICLIRPSMKHYLGVFSCRATNILASTQAHMLVYVSDPETDVPANQNGKVALVWIVTGVVAALLLVMISIVVIVVTLKRKATARIQQKRTDDNCSLPRSPCGSNAARRYEIMSSARSPDTEYVGGVDQHYETIIYETPGVEDHYRTEYLEIVDVQYETSNNSVYTNSLISHVANSDLEYENIRSNI